MWRLVRLTDACHLQKLGHGRDLHLTLEQGGKHNLALDQIVLVHAVNELIKLVIVRQLQNKNRGQAKSVGQLDHLELEVVGDCPIFSKKMALVENPQEL